MKSLVLKDLLNIGHNAKSMLFILWFLLLPLSRFLVLKVIYSCVPFCVA